METLPFVALRNDLPDKPLILFLAGFPDNQLSALHPTIPEALSKDYNLVCLCLPGYESGSKNTTIPSWGYSFDELIKLLDNSIVLHRKSNQPLYLFAHDWGAFIALNYIQKYPDTVDKIMLLDVGVVDLNSMSFREVMVVIVYQWWFAFSFILSQTLGHYIGLLFFGLFFLPIMKPFWPTLKEKPTIPVKEYYPEKCYPYYYFWKAVWGRRKDLTPRTPKIPTLFMYGTKKNCMFHSQRFLNVLDQRPDCKQLSVEGGHWFAKTAPEVVIKEVLDFVAN
eukprot:gene702-760_t